MLQLIVPGVKKVCFLVVGDTHACGNTDLFFGTQVCACGETHVFVERERERERERETQACVGVTYVCGSKCVWAHECVWGHIFVKGHTCVWGGNMRMRTHMLARRHT